MTYNKIVRVCTKCNKELYDEEILNNDKDAPYYDPTYGPVSVPYISLCCYSPVAEEWTEE